MENFPSDHLALSAFTFTKNSLERVGESRLQYWAYQAGNQGHLKKIPIMIMKGNRAKSQDNIIFGRQPIF